MFLNQMFNSNESMEQQLGGNEGIRNTPCLRPTHASKQ